MKFCKCTRKKTNRLNFFPVPAIKNERFETVRKVRGFHVNSWQWVRKLRQGKTNFSKGPRWPCGIFSSFLRAIYPFFPGRSFSLCRFVRFIRGGANDAKCECISFYMRNSGGFRYNEFEWTKRMIGPLFAGWKMVFILKPQQYLAWKAKKKNGKNKESALLYLPERFHYVAY